MSGRDWQSGYASHADFYADVYGQHVRENRKVGALGVTLIESHQTRGDWSDAPTPELVTAWLPSPGTGYSIDLGAGRFGGVYRPGNAVVVAPHIRTSIQMEDRHVCRILAVPYGSLMQAINTECVRLPDDGDFGRVHAGLIDDRRFCALLDELWRESREGNGFGSLFTDAAVLQLVAHLLRLKGAYKNVPRRGLSPWQARRAAEIIESALADDLPLIKLADTVGLSPNHFCTAFSRSFGEPPHRYRLRRRVEHAQSMLINPKLPITEIALACGFNSSAHFATTFRKHVGVSPSAWRRERLS
ncbi:helix-turn-helix domain-containing protein [Bosea eneae]|uniref:Helix-turn-helix domain-containing protein n=1 Tax=Bosea eneae TaxID=151454 RepID=A0ABW0IXQ7_9HYPH